MLVKLGYIALFIIIIEDGKYSKLLLLVQELVNNGTYEWWISDLIMDCPVYLCPLGFAVLRCYCTGLCCKCSTLVMQNLNVVGYLNNSVLYLLAGV